MSDIDFVFPFVDNKDPIWQNAYIEKRRELNLSTEMNTVRFRDWELLRYLFRGIEKYMPWIRKIHMIVSNPEQIPTWLDTSKVHIVLHKDIIPKEFLPTFNSTTIEMFLGNIEGLANNFIYSNDDFYPTAPMEASDFFEKGIPKLSFKTDSGQNTMFKQVEYGTQKIIADHLGIQLPNPNDMFVKIPHTMTPMSKTTVNLVARTFRNQIKDSITPFRTNRNFNQYIYTYYNLFTEQYLDSERTYHYFQFKEGEQPQGYITDKVKVIADYIINQKTQTICINDTVKFTDIEFLYIKKVLKEAFETVLPDLSEYELKDYVSDKYLTFGNLLNKVVATFTPLDEYQRKQFIEGVSELVKKIVSSELLEIDNSEDGSDNS